MATDSSQRRDEIERRHEEAFREEAEALRSTLVHYMTGELSDGQLKEAAQRVIRESFKDLVQQTLKQEDLHQRIATDLVSVLLEGLRQSVPGLQAQALQQIQADLERQWTDLLPQLTQNALQRVVQQQLVPQNLPEILRGSLADAFARRDPELRQEIASQRKLQEDTLRKELNELWRSSLPAVLERSLEQAVSGHLSQDALRVQVEKVVSHYLQGLDLEVQQRFDLSQTIGTRQRAELERVRGEIENQWKGALPGMVQEGLSAVLNRELSAKTLDDRISARIEEVVKQRVAAIEERLRQEFNVQQRIQMEQPKWDTTARQLLADHWNNVLPDMMTKSFEDALLDQLTLGTLDGRLRALIDEKLKVSFPEPSKQEKPPEQEKPLEQEKPPEQETQPPQAVKEGAPAPQNARPRRLGKLGDLWERWAQRPQVKREARWAAVVLLLLLLGLASYYFFFRRNGNPPKSPGQQSGPVGVVPSGNSNSDVPVAPMPPHFAVEGLWTAWMQEQEAALKQHSGQNLNDLYTCWYRGSEDRLQQLWGQVEGTRTVNLEALKNAFPACASQETRDKAVVLSAQLAIKKALEDAKLRKACPAEDQQIAAATASSLSMDGDFGGGTRRAFELFLRCSKIDPSALPQQPTSLHNLFLVYAALRKTHPAGNG